MLFSEEKKGCSCTVFRILQIVFRVNFGFALCNTVKSVLIFFREGRVSEKALAVKAEIFYEKKRNGSACKAKHFRGSLTALSFSDGEVLPKVREEQADVGMFSQEQRLSR